jgi:probable rRNA maturation factor
MTSDFLIDFTLLKSARVPTGVMTEKDLKDLAVFVLQAERVEGPATLSLDLTGHERIHALNRRFRGVDRTTDVISFRENPRPALSGDIAINVVQAAVQAKKIKHSLPRELRLLWIHGILHLLDYTDYDPVPRRKMFKRQNQLLRQWELRAGKK